MEQAAQAAAAANMIKLLMAGYGGFSKAFYQKYGKEALPIIAAVMGQGGTGTAKPHAGQGIKAYAEALKMISSVSGMGVEVVELSDDMIHFKALHCPFGIENTSRELCETMMNVDRQMLNTFLGQEGDVKVLQTVAAGDKVCEIIESKK